MKLWYDIVLEAKKIISQRRQNSKEKADRELAKYLSLYPNLKELYQERKSMVIKIAKAEVQHKSIEDLKKEYQRLGVKLKENIVVLNIPKEEILPKYHCQQCKDLGAVNGFDCDCLNEEIYKLQMENNGFINRELPDFETINFDIIDNKNKDQQRAYYELLKKLVDNQNSKYKLVSIFGGVGVGKTHMLECVFDRALKNNLYSIYKTSFDLNSEMLRYHVAKMGDKEQILKPYLECDILCIDDMGTENHINNVTTEYYYLILNERITKGKQTYITTNLNLEQIRDVYDDRIFSRMCSNINALKLNIMGEDLRLKK